MGVEDNKKTVQLVEEAWNRGDLAAIDEHFSQKFDNSGAAVPGLPQGLEGAKIAHGGAMQSFPDRKVEILDLIGEGDKVFVRTRITGTNKGGFPFLGAPANDAKIDFSAVGVYTFDKKGKITSHYGLNDAFMLGIQLGAITPPGM